MLREETMNKQGERNTKGSNTEDAQASVEANDINRALLLYKPVPSNKILFNYELGASWFEEDSGEVSKLPVQSHVLKHLEETAFELLAADVQLYEKVRLKKRKSDVEWLRTVMVKGTLADKTSARALLVQESPVHNIAALDALLVMCRKKSKRESIQAIDVLKELWLTCLLPHERKLRKFEVRPFSTLLESANSLSPRDKNRKLMLWYAESQFKSCYRDFIGVLEVHLHDPVSSIRSKILGHVFDLLAQRPEQESILLSLLVNKLGDPEGKVASKASLFLLKLVMQHQNMRLVVVKEVENLLYRPNVSSRAQYYAVCFLNQIYLRKSDSQLASRLIGVYFVFFKALVQKEDLDAKMLSALLTGVNRAFPFTEGEIDAFEEHIDTLFKAVHVAPLATGVQALMLLYQVMESRNSVSDRFYRALYAKLLDQELCMSSKQAMFLNVLYKSLKSDPEISRIKAFMKRIFQTCGHHSPPFICGCLILVSEILKEKPSLKSFILSPEAEDEEEHFSDVPLEEDCDPPIVDGEGLKEGTEDSRQEHERRYRGLNRNPLYCRAEHSCLWELEKLSKHYHPSVQVLAQTVLKGDCITYPSDPLQDFTLVKFLDRFVFKNPKQKESDHGGSVMQSFRRSEVASSIPANNPEFAAQNEKNVREDEKYLYWFFKQQQLDGEGQTKKKSKKMKESDSLDGIDTLLGEDEGLDTVDFASEFTKKKVTKKSKKLAKEELDSSEEDKGSEEEFSYDNFNFEEEEDVAGDDLVQQREPSQADYERVLLENLTSSEDEEDHPKPAKRKKTTPGRKASRIGSDADGIFATADDFSHILEEEGSGFTWKGERVSSKQLKWEGRRQGAGFSKHHRGKQRKSNDRRTQRQSRAHKHKHKIQRRAE